MNINKQNKFGESALHLCSGQNKNLDLAKFLIMKGANPNVKNQLGDSPLGIKIYIF
jgi:ankyrin repeat protein